MKTVLLGLLCVLTGVGTAAAQAPTQADHETQKKVLVIHASRQDAPYTVLIERAFRKTLGDGLAGHLDYYTEYIDFGRFSTPEYQMAMRDFLRRKYAGQRLDVIITEGHAPFEFVVRHREEIFPGAPLVFSLKEGEWRPIPNATGVVFPIDMKSTLALALRLQPHVKRVFVIRGASEFDLFYEKIARWQFQEYEGRLAFTYLPPMPLTDLLEAVARLPEDAILYFVSLFEDGAGNRLIPAEIVERLSPVASAPLYCWPEMTIEHGIVGGKLLSEEQVAHQTAEVALRVLRGEPPEQIPSATISPYINVFDWRQLRRWRISEDRLPPGSVIRFKEASFWSLYKWRIIGMVSLCTAEALLIVGLLVNRSRRGQAEEALRASEELHRIVLSNISDAVFITDNNGAFTFVCPNVDVIFGYSFEEAWSLGHITHILGTNLFLPEALAAAGEMRNIEREVTAKSGAVHTLLVSVKRVSIRDGTLLYVCRDITDLRVSRAQIDNLAGRLIIAQEEERKYLARELHDDLSQQLAALSIACSGLKRRLPAEDAEVQQEMVQLQQRTLTLAEGVRYLSHNLHPGVLQHAGLVAALQAHCAEFDRQHAIAVTLSADDPGDIPQDVALCLYRVAQEALRNVAAHAGARQVHVALRGTAAGLELTIADDGQGFDLAEARRRGGLGLISLDERVRLVRGDLQIHTQRQRGTELRIQVPLRGDAQAPHDRPARG